MKENLKKILKQFVDGEVDHQQLLTWFVDSYAEGRMQLLNESDYQKVDIFFRNRLDVYDPRTDTPKYTLKRILRDIKSLATGDSNYSLDEVKKSAAMLITSLK